MNNETKNAISEIWFDAAISKAIQDKRELLKPSMQHFLNGGNVNGEFNQALMRLCKWVEKTTIELLMNSNEPGAVSSHEAEKDVCEHEEYYCLPNGKYQCIECGFTF